MNFRCRDNTSAGENEWTRDNLRQSGPADSCPRRVWILVIVLGCAAVFAGEANDELDILIRNGTVYDGSLIGPFDGDIGIRGDKIVYLEASDGIGPPAAHVIDAAGLVVAPGFIDPHTHVVDDLLSSDPLVRLNTGYLTQGVTTVVIGNDGSGTTDIAALLGQMDAKGVGTNVVPLVGHGAVRRHVMHNAARAPTNAEMTQMASLVGNAMRSGAFGLSTGLYYVPGNFASTEEVIALAQVAAEYGGIYESHLRDEGSSGVGLLAAVDEAIRIGREANVPVHIAHIKALGADVWGKSSEVIERVVAARRNGQQVTADQYPWLASGTSLRNSLLPQWAREGTEEEIQTRLASPEMRREIIPHIEENLRRRGGADSLVLTGDGRGAVPSPWVKWQGMSLSEVAAKSKSSPVDATLMLIEQGDPRVISFNMSEEDVLTFVQQPWVMTSSDGTSGHPRKVASYPKKYLEYVKKRELLTLSEYIHRSSGLVADTFKLQKRGYLELDYAADIVIFDPARFRPNASYSAPARLSDGVQFLLVNGQIVIDDGTVRHVHAGRTLRRAEPAEQSAYSKPVAEKTVRIATVDSGFGGYFTAKSIEYASRDLIERYDAEFRIVHYGDTRNAPYGEESPVEIAELGKRGVLNALHHGADKVFIACNTASTQYEAIQQAVESRYPGRARDVVSIVDASADSAKDVIDLRLLDYDSAHVAILATPATVKSMVYPRRLAQLYGIDADEDQSHSFARPRWFKANGPSIEYVTQKTTLRLPSDKTIHIYQMAPGNWVDLIEHGGNLAEKSKAVTEDLTYLFAMLPAHAALDVVGYFCTHYPALDNAIQLEVARHNRSHADTVYLQQATLMGNQFRQSAENILEGHERYGKINLQVRDTLTERSRPVITITGDNVAETMKLARTFYPDDPEPFIVREMQQNPEIPVEYLNEHTN